MKIALRLTVEVDPDEWAEEYQIERSEVREDVRRYVEGVFMSGEVACGLLNLIAGP